MIRYQERLDVGFWRESANNGRSVKSIGPKTIRNNRVGGVQQTIRRLLLPQQIWQEITTHTAPYRQSEAHNILGSIRSRPMCSRGRKPACPPHLFPFTPCTDRLTFLPIGLQPVEAHKTTKNASQNRGQQPNLNSPNLFTLSVPNSLWVFPDK